MADTKESKNPFIDMEHYVPDGRQLRAFMGRGPQHVHDAVYSEEEVLRRMRDEEILRLCVEEERRFSMMCAEDREFRRQLENNRMEMPLLTKNALTAMQQQLRDPGREFDITRRGIIDGCSPALRRQLQKLRDTFTEQEQKSAARKALFATRGEPEPMKPGPTCAPTPPLPLDVSSLYQQPDLYICKFYDGKRTCGRSTCMHPRPEKK